MFVIRGNGKRAEINSRDVDYLVKIVRADVRYLKGRSARPRPGTDANATKMMRRQELADKLESLRRKP